MRPALGSQSDRWACSSRVTRSVCGTSGPEPIFGPETSRSRAIIQGVFSCFLLSSTQGLSAPDDARNTTKIVPMRPDRMQSRKLHQFGDVIGLAAAHFERERAA